MLKKKFMKRDLILFIILIIFALLADSLINF